MGNVVYNSIQYASSSYQFSNKMKIQIYKTTVLFVVKYVSETWCLTLKKKRPKGVCVKGAEEVKAIYGLELIASPNLLRAFRSNK